MAKKKVKKKTSRNRQPLVLGFLEKISSKVFPEFSKQVTDIIGNHHGVYALYKGNRLYYVGLASILRKRLKRHLSDKHAGKWDKFSLYLVRHHDHIKELESLILRIADPKGNKTTGRLPKAENLRGTLKKRINDEYKRKLGGIIPDKAAVKTTRKSRATKAAKAVMVPGKKVPPLSPYISKGFKIKGTYKGKDYFATVRANGSINYNNQVFNSPSMAANAVSDHSYNGWRFWRFKNAKGEWVRLNELKKGK